MENKISKVNEFLEEIINVCKKYKLSISHEDTHGSFIIEDYSEKNIKQLQQARFFNKFKQ
jgi:hypothetical protein